MDFVWPQAGVTLPMCAMQVRLHCIHRSVFVGWRLLCCTPAPCILRIGSLRQSWTHTHTGVRALTHSPARACEHPLTSVATPVACLCTRSTLPKTRVASLDVSCKSQLIRPHFKSLRQLPRAPLQAATAMSLQTKAWPLHSSATARLGSSCTASQKGRKRGDTLTSTRSTDGRIREKRASAASSSWDSWLTVLILQMPVPSTQQKRRQGSEGGGFLLCPCRVDGWTAHNRLHPVTKAWM